MYFYCYVSVFLLYVYVWLPWLRFFRAFFLSCKANARVKPAKTGHGLPSSQFLCCSMYFCFVSFRLLFVCICVLSYCHRVTIQLQFTNISYYQIETVPWSITVFILRIAISLWFIRFVIIKHKPTKCTIYYINP